MRIHVDAKIWTIFTYLLCTLKGEYRHEGHTSIPLLHSLEQASQSVSNFPDPAVILSVIKPAPTQIYIIFYHVGLLHIWIWIQLWIQETRKLGKGINILFRFIHKHHTLCTFQIILLTNIMILILSIIGLIGVVIWDLTSGYQSITGRCVWAGYCIWIG